jgi:hypothetical protein
MGYGSDLDDQSRRDRAYFLTIYWVYIRVEVVDRACPCIFFYVVVGTCNG